MNDLQSVATANAVASTPTPAAPPAPVAVPEAHADVLHYLGVPLFWLIDFHARLFSAMWYADLWSVGLLKRIFLLLPTLALMAGMWATLLMIYTLLFRSNRTQLIGMFLVLWWDAARSTWLFWFGMARFLFVAFGTFWGLIRLLVAICMEILKEIVGLPFALTGVLTKNLRTPGVPWIAFLMTVGWSVLEAVIFAYLLTPTFSGVVSDIVGTESPRYLTFFLFGILLVIISGSLACLHVLVEAIRLKDVKQIVQMVIVEVVVMFVEVLFLYRELIDSITPWISQQTGYQMGAVTTILLASLAWVGVRGVVWFLFARFGTPTLLALISRQRLTEEVRTKESADEADQRWGALTQKIKTEQQWFVEQANRLLEAAVLPVFQVIAAGLNFCTALFMARTLFSLPFKSLAEVKETRSLLQSLSALPELK